MAFDAVPDSPSAQASKTDGENVPLVLPLGELDRGKLAVAGGKGANLGELIRAGFPVPPGFCVTTPAYEVVANAADLGSILAELATTAPTDAMRLEELASATRERLLAASIPDGIRAAIASAYAALGQGQPVPVAV